MDDPEGFPHDEALRRFDQRLETVAAAQKRGPDRFVGAEGGASAGYRVLGELIGGLLSGLGLGWLFDRFAHTAPLGLIVTAAAVYVAVRSATRASAPPAVTKGGPGDGA